MRESPAKGRFRYAQRTYAIPRCLPNITQWVESYGWLEIGQDDSSSSFIKILDAGGLVWESSKKYSSLEAALRELEAQLGKIIDEIG